MSELLKHFAARKGVTAALLVSSFLISVLALASPLFVIQVLNRYVAFGVDATLFTLATGAIIAVILEFGFRQVRHRFAAGVTVRPNEALSMSSFGILTTSKSAALERIPPGIRRQIISGANAIQALYSAPNITTMLDLPFAILFIIALALLSPILASIAAAFIAVALFITYAGAVSMKQTTKDMTAASGTDNVLVSSAINASDTVRAFNAGPFLRRTWQEHTRFAQGLTRKMAVKRGLLQSLSQSMTGIMTIVVIGVGATLVVQAQLDVGAMIGCNILASRALATVIRVANLGETIAKASQATIQFKEFNRLPLEAQQGSALAEFHGRISFQDLTVSHPGSVTPLIESLNLNLEPGTFLVVTGANGTGKTTLCRLLLGLIEPQRGHLMIDGVDLRQIAPEWWRRQVCYLPQEPSFLNATIADNLRANNPEMDEAGLNKIINDAGLRPFMDKTLKGMDTPVTDNGRHLALGIRRRMALARAMATKGRLVVFDEPTEAMDAEGCKAVYTMINYFMQEGRTIIACTQDPQIMRSAHILDLNFKPTPKVVPNPNASKGNGGKPEALNVKEPALSLGEAAGAGTIEEAGEGA